VAGKPNVTATNTEHVTVSIDPKRHLDEIVTFAAGATIETQEDELMQEKLKRSGGSEMLVLEH